MGLVMICLEADGAVAIIDPSHGGEVLELIGCDGQRPLGRPPFSASPPLSGDLDEAMWTDRYRGGWQLVSPNAGMPSDVNGDVHGFHGGASIAVWEVVTREPSSLVLTLVNHGLRYNRTYVLRASGLRIETLVEVISEPRPFVAIEHVVVGVQVLDPEVLLEVSAGRAFDIEEPNGSLPLPTDAPMYPDVLHLDGSVERMSSWKVDDVSARTFVVSELEAGWAQVRNTATGEGLRLTWDVSVLPHMWVWHENRSTGGPWRNATELLGIEPAMVPHSIGLDGALQSGHARIVTAQTPCRWWIDAELIPATTSRTTRWS